MSRAPERLPADNGPGAACTPSPRPATLSRDGTFANGVNVTTVIQFILDHDEAAPIDDVAAWFRLDAEDVVAALRHCALPGSHR